MQPGSGEIRPKGLPRVPKRLAVLAALAASGRPAVTKPDRCREICDLDITTLADTVQRISEAEWDAQDAAKENAFAVFRQTRHIVARFSDGAAGPETYHSNAVWTRWAPLLSPILDAVTARYDLKRPEVSKLMLARLAAGGSIDPHYDVGLSNHLTHKIHVPLATNDDVWFTVDGERLQLAAGKAYELNNIKLHAVRNDGSADRIHLIFELFDQAAVPRQPL